MQGVHYLHGNTPLGGYGPWVSPDAVLPSRHGKGLWWQEGPKEGSLLAASSTARKLSSNRKKCSLLATVSKSCSICSQGCMRQQHMLTLAQQCKVLLMQDSSWQEMCRSLPAVFDQCNVGCLTALLGGKHTHQQVSQQVALFDLAAQVLETVSHDFTLEVKCQGRRP